MVRLNTNPVRGTRDILPEEMECRNNIENKILEVYRKHGFERIETPAIENLDLLLNSDGGENLKMIFTILKRGEKLRLQEGSSLKEICDIGLRYDLTLPLSRFYGNNKNQLQLPFKSIQIDHVYRAERPQKGRFRSFKQCDIDIIGEGSIDAEIDLITTTAKALKTIGLNHFSIRINDRRILSNIIVSSGFSSEEVRVISIVLDKLDKIGENGIKEELVKKGYTEDKVYTLVDNFKKIGENNFKTIIDDASIVQDLQKVIQVTRELSNGEYSIQFDPSLVRGMGYYTGQIFEISYEPYGFSIAGGGRYDNMIGNISNESVPAVGFSIGFERIITILMEERNNLSDKKKRVALFYQQDDHFVDVMKEADGLRNQNYDVSIILSKKKLSKQINQLKNFNQFMIYGNNELKDIGDEDHVS
ncbi:MAG: histidine--tRNA ligase [Eubacteriales bacterium]